MTLLAAPAAGPPGPAGRGRRRRWLIGGTIAWLVVLVAVAVVSAGRDRATVPDQIDIAAALPEVDRAAGTVFIAADGVDRVLVVGELQLDRDCDITPVRPGAEAIRDLTVHVRAGEAPAVLDAIAAALPRSYEVHVSHSRGGTRHLLNADAGDFVAVDGTVDDTGTVLTLRMSTGCRPLGAGVGPPVTSAGTVQPASQSAAAQSAALGAAVDAVRLTGRDAVRTREIRCPTGGAARTVEVSGEAAPADLGRALNQATAGATVVEASTDRYAYRTGATSMVVTAFAERATVTATIGCS